MMNNILYIIVKFLKFYSARTDKHKPMSLDKTIRVYLSMILNK